MRFEKKWVNTPEGNRMLLTTAILPDGKRVGPLHAMLPHDVESDFRTTYGQGLDRMLEDASQRWLEDLISHSPTEAK